MRKKREHQLEKIESCYRQSFMRSLSVCYQRKIKASVEVTQIIVT